MDGRIVVGVDGSPQSVAALRWAAAEARLRNATLHLVTAWHVPYMAYAGFPAMVLPQELPRDLERSAKALQEAALAEAVGDQGGLRVETHVVEGQASSALLRAARDAEMLVVGSRGLGGFGELLLGSVSQQCAHHAPCPVVIVRHHSGSEPAAGASDSPPRSEGTAG